MWTGLSRAKPANRGKAAPSATSGMPCASSDQVILTKFHEGIDISPVNRDRAGNPLDLVSSIADGRVVHISPISGRSNYGKYVVVEHIWENSSIYLALRAPRGNHLQTRRSGESRLGARTHGIHRSGHQPHPRPRPSRTRDDDEPPLRRLVEGLASTTTATSTA